MNRHHVYVRDSKIENCTLKAWVGMSCGTSNMDMVPLRNYVGFFGKNLGGTKV